MNNEITPNVEGHFFISEGDLTFAPYPTRSLEAAFKLLREGWLDARLPG